MGGLHDKAVLVFHFHDRAVQFESFAFNFNCRLNVQTRWAIRYDDFFHAYTNIPSFMKGMVGRRLKKMTYAVGVGRHSNEEVEEMMKHDLLMLSELLGRWAAPTKFVHARTAKAQIRLRERAV